MSLSSWRDAPVGSEHVHPCWAGRHGKLQADGRYISKVHWVALALINNLAKKLSYLVVVSSLTQQRITPSHHVPYTTVFFFLLRLSGIDSRNIVGRLSEIGCLMKLNVLIKYIILCYIVVELWCVLHSDIPVILKVVAALRYSAQSSICPTSRKVWSFISLLQYAIAAYQAVGRWSSAWRSWRSRRSWRLAPPCGSLIYTAGHGGWSLSSLTAGPSTSSPRPPYS